MKLEKRVLSIEKRLPENQYLVIEDLLRMVHLQVKQDLTDYRTVFAQGDGEQARGTETCQDDTKSNKREDKA